MTPAALSRIASDALAKAGASDAQIVAVAACIEAALGDAQIDGLTRTQARVVRVLMAARGRPVTKHLLLEAAGADGVDKLADVYVCKVRRLRPDLGQHIKTVWGQGYMWTGPAEGVE